MGMWTSWVSKTSKIWQPVNETQQTSICLRHLEDKIQFIQYGTEEYGTITAINMQFILTELLIEIFLTGLWGNPPKLIHFAEGASIFQAFVTAFQNGPYYHLKSD